MFVVVVEIRTRERPRSNTSLNMKLFDDEKNKFESPRAEGKYLEEKFVRER